MESDAALLKLVNFFLLRVCLCLKRDWEQFYILFMAPNFNSCHLEKFGFAFTKV